MITISASDVIKKPSYISNPTDITFVEDAKKHITKSVVLPYHLYMQFKDIIEDEMYLQKNKKALNKKAYDEFLETEDIIEDSL
jgi:GR25 family glycosyltransferase involved in LPS biosynthesis